MRFAFISTEKALYPVVALSYSRSILEGKDELLSTEEPPVSGKLSPRS